MGTLTPSLFAGVFYLVAGCLGLARHFLLEPSIPNYPRAPRWLLNIFFAFASMLVFAGLRYLSVWLIEQNPSTPPNATAMTVLISGGILIYKSGLFANVLTQRYPASVWIRINRFQDFLKCRRG